MQPQPYLPPGGPARALGVSLELSAQPTRLLFPASLSVCLRPLPSPSSSPSHRSLSTLLLPHRSGCWFSLCDISSPPCPSLHRLDCQQPPRGPAASDSLNFPVGTCGRRQRLSSALTVASALLKGSLFPGMPRPGTSTYCPRLPARTFPPFLDKNWVSHALDSGHMEGRRFASLSLASLALFLPLGRSPLPGNMNGAEASAAERGRF